MRRLLPLIAVILILSGTALAAVEPPKGGTPPQNDKKQQLNGDGCACDAVKLTVDKEPDKPIAKPSPATDKPTTPVGAFSGDRADNEWKVTVSKAADTTKDDCCKAIQVGVINNLLSEDLEAQYGDKAKIVHRFVDADGKAISLPLLDTGRAPDAAGFPHPSAANSFKNPGKCGDQVTIGWRDFPNAPPVAAFPPVMGGKKLTKIIRHPKFRLFLEWECPKGTYKVLKFYDWEVSYTIAVTVDDTVKPPKVTVDSFSGSGSESARGDTPDNAPKTPVSSGETPNTAGNRPGAFVPEGF